MKALTGFILCAVSLGLIGVSSGITATRAGSSIANRAQVSCLFKGELQVADSNDVFDRIAEVLDVALAVETPSRVRLDQQTEAQPVPFLLRNEGNGIEAFLVSGEIAGSNAKLRSLAVDTNSNGRFDPAIDSIIGPKDPTPSLEPGTTLRLFALVDVAEEGQADLVVYTRSITGTGPAGTLFATLGDSGSDALTGQTRAEASVSISLTLAGAPVSLVKSQQILTADGSNMPVSGAIIRYVIEARLMAGASVSDARVVDPVPTGTSYVPGSLRLDGTALSEAADDDPGLLSSNVVEVALGNFAGAQVRTIAFDVKIN